MWFDNGWRTGGKVDVRLPGKGNSNTHGAKLVHLIITMIKWIRTSRLSIRNSLSGVQVADKLMVAAALVFLVCGYAPPQKLTDSKVDSAPSVG